MGAGPGLGVVWDAAKRERESDPIESNQPGQSA
jgi:hypothetical protein